MKWLTIEPRLRALGLSVMTDREFRAAAHVTPTAAKFLLIRYTRRGLLCRLKRGLYALRDRMPSPWNVANRLYGPSYVSLQSALSHHGLIPESVYAITSVTTRSTRRFEADERLYLYRTLPARAFTGYRGLEIAGQTVLLAEPEKAVADYLYFAHVRREPVDERLALDRIDRRRVLRYLELFRNAGMMRWFLHDLPLADRRTAR